jgi:3-oxoacyl-[acyl-carrier protein] reductase
MFQLENKTAIITGASRGIGKAISHQLAKSGANVICVSRHIEDLEKVASEIRDEGYSALAIAGDISDYESFANLVKKSVDEFKTVDILVNNAGITRDGLIMRMQEKDWDAVIEINLKGAFNGIKAVVRSMMKQRFGRIINISSVVGITGNAGQSNYSASKAGLIGLTKASAKELASRGITVNCVAPGYIETDMTSQLSVDVKNALVKQIPLGRIGQGQEVAYLVQYLCSDEAGYITGQTFTIDGGMVMS